MKALILSGGKGTRLHPITYTNAKQLVPVANKPILFYVLETVIASGVREIGIIVGDTHEEFKAAVGDGKRFGSDVTITYILQKYPLGLAHAVKIAQPFLGDDRFLMFLGDNFIEESICEQVKQFDTKDCPYHAQVFLARVEQSQQFGVAQLARSDGHLVDLDGEIAEGEVLRLVHVVEKPSDPVSNLALVGIYCFDWHIFEAVSAIRPSARGELEITDAIQYLVDHGYEVRPHLLRGCWIDTGKIQDLLDANRTVLSRIQSEIRSGASVDQYSHLYGEVILEENARLLNSIVRGPCIIGPNVTLTNTYIGPFTSIDHDSTVINSEIEHSIVLEGCKICDISGRIEDSLIGRYVQIYPSSSRPHAHKLLLGDRSRVEIL